LLRRLTRVSWVEAVAIVEALTAILIHADGREAPVPELSDISITARGTVLARARAVDGLAGPRLARTLLALTSSGAIPVPLRLLITKWASFSEKHSIRTFAGELGFFARPDGELLIRAVYERYMVSPPAASPPEPDASEVAPQQDHPLRRRRLPGSIWLGVAVLVIGAVLVWLWREGSVSSHPEPSSSLVTLMSNAAQAARRIAVEASERVGLSALGATGSSESPTEPPSAGAPGPRRSATTSSARSPQSANRSQTGGTLAAARPPAEGPWSAPGMTAGTVLGALASPIREPEASTAAVSDDANDSSRLYSGEDPDVEPPEMSFSQLPAPLLMGIRAEVNTIEVVVSETGTVEHVRLVSPPRRMADMMMLSSAKTWKFEPASRQGKSVRYRLVVSWTATP
jgi:cytoskeletal protein RodZ